MKRKLNIIFNLSYKNRYHPSIGNIIKVKDQTFIHTTDDLSNAVVFIALRVMFFFRN